MFAMGSLHAQAKKPLLTLDEFFNAVDFTKIAVSPDGHMVVIATDRADWRNERYRQDLWLWRDSDNGLILLTQSGHDSDPKWSPDGKWIAFVSDRNSDDDDSEKSDADSKGVAHVYLISISGGEAIPVTRGAEDVHSFAWNRDSKSLYFATRIPWSKKQKEDYGEKWKDVVRYRERERGDVISRIAVVEVLKRQIELGLQEKKKSKDNKKKASDDDEETGETPGAEAIVTSPYRIKSMDISPDGSQVAFSTDSISQRFEGLEEIEVYVATTMKAGPLNSARQITKNEALEDNVQWSPDGKNLFFRVEQGSVEAKYADFQPRVYSVDVTSRRPARWASDFHGSLSHYAVQSNGALLVPGMLGTATALYEQASAQQSFRRLEGWPGTYAHVATAANSPHIAFAYSEVDKPIEVYIAESADSLNSAKPITSFNKLFTERNLPKG